MPMVFRIALLIGFCLPAATFADDTVALSTPAVDTSSASAVSSAPAHVWRTVPNTAFGVPESLEFVIRWGVVTAGRSTLNVENFEMIDGRQTYHLVSQARSVGMVDTFYRVADRNEAWLDRHSLTSVRYSKRLREGSFSEDTMTELDQPRRHWKSVEHRLDKNRTREREGELPPDVLDVQSSLYFVRTLPLEIGKKFSLDVHSGDKIYPLVVTVLRREKVSVPAGKFDCWVVEPLLRGPGMFVSKGKKLQVWLTADERRMPVRMRSEVFFGHVSAELERYKVTPPEAADK